MPNNVYHTAINLMQAHVQPSILIIYDLHISVLNLETYLLTNYMTIFSHLRRSGKWIVLIQSCVRKPRAWINLWYERN